MRSPLKTWFDRTNRYRVSAAILVVPGILTILSHDLGLVDISFGVRRTIYWIGLAVLLTAVALDTWSIYAGKRKVKRMINERVKS